MIIWLIICILGCIAAGWQMFVTLHEDEPRSTKILAVVLTLVTILLLILSVFAFKQHIIETTVLENYHIEQVITTDTTYIIHENPW